MTMKRTDYGIRLYFFDLLSKNFQPILPITLITLITSFIINDLNTNLYDNI